MAQKEKDNSWSVWIPFIIGIALVANSCGLYMVKRSVDTRFDGIGGIRHDTNVNAMNISMLKFDVMMLENAKAMDDGKYAPWYDEEPEIYHHREQEDPNVYKDGGTVPADAFPEGQCFEFHVTVGTD